MMRMRKPRPWRQNSKSSMQAIMAAAIAIDSLYAALRDKASIPDETVQSGAGTERLDISKLPKCFAEPFPLFLETALISEKT